MTHGADPKLRLPARTDKAAFRAFVGVMLLIACVPAAVWSYWSYTAYQQALDHTRSMIERTDETKTSLEREQTLTIRNSIAGKYRREALLSGAGSLALLGGSLLMFVLAINSRKIRQQFARVDWDRTPVPLGRVQVKYSRLFDLLAAFLFLFLGSLMLLLLRGMGIRAVSVIIIILIAVFLTAFLFLIIRAKRKAVSLFDENGTTRGDGRVFGWNEFQGAITEIDFTRVAKQRYLWRVKFAFENGEQAWIIPSRVKNEEEVFDYVANLPKAFEQTQ